MRGSRGNEGTGMNVVESGCRGYEEKARVGNEWSVKRGNNG